MINVDDLDAFNLSALARELGIPIQTVYGWRRIGNIPSWRQESVKKAIDIIKSEKTNQENYQKHKFDKQNPCQGVE